MKRFSAILLGLLMMGIGCLIGVIAILNIVGVGQRLPLVPLILALAMSFAMLCVGLVTWLSFSYETSFDKNGIEMQFVFRKDRVLRESIEWHKNIGFRNKILGGANVWVVLKYKLPNGHGTLFRRAILFVPGIGPVVGTATRDFKTPLDAFSSTK
jgi:hypothetical protein